MKLSFKRRICFFLSIVLILSLAAPCFAASGSTIVYKTKTGEKYHNAGCRYLSKSCIEITLEAAVKTYGLSPCSVCKPPQLDSSTPAASTPGSSQSPQTATSGTRLPRLPLPQAAPPSQATGMCSIANMSRSPAS